MNCLVAALVLLSVSFSEVSTAESVVASPVDKQTTEAVLKIAMDAAPAIAASISATLREKVLPSELSFESPYAVGFVEETRGDGCIAAFNSQLFNWNPERISVPVQYRNSTTAVRLTRQLNGQFRLEDLSRLPNFDFPALYIREALNRGGQGGTVDRYYLLIVDHKTVVAKLSDNDATVNLAMAGAGFAIYGLPPFAFMQSDEFIAKTCEIINRSDSDSDAPG